MASSVSYGMGQYRFTKNYNYITELLNATGNDGSNNIIYQRTGDSSSGWYKDILVKLPVVNSNNTPIVQYGQTYFLKLSVPRNRQYTITLNLKLCPANTSNEPMVERFQQIGPTEADDDIYSEVILYKNPVNESVEVALIDIAHDETEQEFPSHTAKNVYKRKDSDGKNIYVYYTNTQNSIEITEFNAVKLIKSWEVVEGEDQIITYKMVFSPKYNLAEGYRFLLIETDRNNLWSNEVQYIDEISGDLFNGTYMNLSSVSCSLYSVNNLLEGGSTGTSQIKSGTNTLSHIGVWGHPEQMIALNGEEIKIGQSGFYEVKDYDITSLGVIVEDPDVDRFTIDYEYRVAR